MPRYRLRTLIVAMTMLPIAAWLFSRSLADGIAGCAILLPLTAAAEFLPHGDLPSDSIMTLLGPGAGDGRAQGGSKPKGENGWDAEKQ